MVFESWEVYLFFSRAAARTKNYSGAELEGVVKSAVSYALNRQLSLDDLTKPVEEENIKVTMDDFLNALHEVIPAFGASTDDLERCRYCFWSQGFTVFRNGLSNFILFILSHWYSENLHKMYSVEDISGIK